MSKRSYERVTRICLFLAVLSAVFFDPQNRFKWLWIAVGSLSGLVAVCLYFYNLLQQPGMPDGQIATRRPLSVMHSPESVEDDGTYTHLNEEATRESHRVLLYNVVWRQENRIADCAYHEQMEQRNIDIATRVTHIVERLSSPDLAGAYEFNLSPDGHFTIRPISHARVAADRRSAPPFDEVSAETHSVKIN